MTVLAPPPSPVEPRLADLFDRGRPVAVLAGAGISLDAPSSLLDGRRFVRGILSRATPEGEPLDLLLSLLDRPVGRLSRPGEYLRFEVLMMCLAQSGLDPELRVLDCLDACDRPNRNHYALAALARRGCVVMTTNFDRLIELAYARLNPGDWPPLTVAVYEREFPERYDPRPGAPTLWKLHGSLSRDGADTRASVRATMQAVLATRGGRRYATFLDSVLRMHDLVTVGYSGADDLDIIPAVGEVRTERRLLWVDHQSAGSLSIKDAAAQLEASPLVWELDAVGRERLWFTLHSTKGQFRDPRGVVTISARTADMMDALNDAYGMPLPVVPDQPFVLHADEYFAAWRARLAAPRSAPYAFLLGATEHTFRPGLQKARDRWQKKLLRLQRAPTATPAEMVSAIVDDYHDLAACVAHDGGHQRVAKAIAALEARLKQHLDAGPPELRGQVLRLFGCLSYLTDDPNSGEAFFTAAANCDSARKDLGEELATLQTWRRVRWAGIGRGVLPGASWVAPGGTRYRTIPQEEIDRRIHELVDLTGRLTEWWRDMLDDGFVSMDDANHRIWFLDKIQRHCVDVGDTLGEGDCARRLALELATQGDIHGTVEQLLRFELLCDIRPELDRARPEMHVQLALIGPRLDLSPQATAKFRDLLAKSMWAGSKPGSAAAKDRA